MYVLLTHLIRKVVRVEQHLYIARLADEGLWLFRFAAEHAWLTAIGYVCFGISINNLQQQQQQGELTIIITETTRTTTTTTASPWRMAKSNQMIRTRTTVAANDASHINRGSCKWDWTTRCPGHKAVSQRIRRNYAATYVII